MGPTRGPTYRRYENGQRYHQVSVDLIYFHFSARYKPSGSRKQVNNSDSRSLFFGVDTIDTRIPLATGNGR